MTDKLFYRHPDADDMEPGIDIQPDPYGIHMILWGYGFQVDAHLGCHEARRMLTSALRHVEAVEAKREAERKAHTDATMARITASGRWSPAA